MQKLVSRNPVQRFKESKKLIKAQGGVKTSAPVNETIGRYVREKNRSLFGSGWRWYDTQAPVGRDHVALNQEIEQDGWILKPNGTKVRASLRNRQQQTTPTQPTTQVGPGSTKAGMEAEYRATHPVTSTPRVARRTPSPTFYGTKAGGQVTNGLGTITPEQKQKLINTGQFTDADFASTKSLQTALNKYFAADNAGSIKEDNLWGNQTQKAFNLALAKADASQIAGAPTIFAVPQPLTIPAQLPKINVETPARTFNRSEIRQYMRDKGLNPYSFTGAQRKALRMIMNGQGTDEDKAVVQGMGIFKRGGNILPFRDPITRFKNRNFRPVTTLKTGGNIPKYQKGNYIVKKGDNLTKIAKQNGMTLQQLLSLNKNIKNPDKINIGQQIITQKTAPKKVTKKTIKIIKNKPTKQSASVTSSLSSIVPNIKNFTNNIYSGLTKMFTPDSQEYIDSKNKDLQAILDHSGQLNNNYTYTYLDRTNNEIKWIRNGKIVDSAGMVSGANDKSDGYTSLPRDNEGHPIYDRSLNLSSTPAGVFTLSKPRSGDIYDKGSLMYHLVETKGDNKQGKHTNVAFHHAPESRKSQINKGIKKLSFGCIYGDCDKSQQKIDKYISQGDTIYSQPIEPGNYLYEENGKIKTHYTSTSPYVSGKTWGQKFNLNNVKYNTGY